MDIWICLLPLQHGISFNLHMLYTMFSVGKCEGMDGTLTLLHPAMK